jgi:hypothetical protein
MGEAVLMVASNDADNQRRPLSANPPARLYLLVEGVELFIEGPSQRAAPL